MAVPLPLHARAFLKSLSQMAGADAVVAALKPLLSRVAAVSRLRRAALVGGCIVFPVLACAVGLFSLTFLQEITRRNPGLMDLSTLLQMRTSARFWGGKNAQLPADRQIAIYIAHHYRGLITNAASWSSPFVLAMIKGDARKFAEQSVAEHPAPTAAEIAEADAAVGKYRAQAAVLRREATSRAAGHGAGRVAAVLCWPAGPGCGIAVPRRGGLAHCRGDVCEEGWPARLPAAPALAGVGGVESGGADVRFGDCRARQALGLATLAGPGIARPAGCGVGRLARARPARPPRRHLAGAALKRFMKNTIILFLTVTTITLGVVCVVQSRKSAGQQTQVAALRGELEAESQQIEDPAGRPKTRRPAAP